jgi:L-histidine Nalpha-methyltransferase
MRVLAREFGGEVDEEFFDHIALWNPDESWMEMRLRARKPVTIDLPGLGLTVHFEAGEEVRTEISAKFTAAGITEELYDAGLIVERSWQHELGYLLLLARPYC